jgi:hypothetical protein
MIKHYQDKDWIDFICKAASLETIAAMQQHLDEGCEACRGLHATWQRVREMADREPSFEPPPGAVRIVKLAYALSQPSHSEEPSVSFARLVFDSLLHPAPAGVRSGEGSARQFLHLAGDIYIDVRWDRHIQLAGQVLNCQQPEKHVKDAEVWVIGGGKLCERTTTNDFGEFQTKCREDKLQWLVIEIEGTKPIAVRLDGDCLTQPPG